MNKYIKILLVLMILIVGIGIGGRINSAYAYDCSRCSDTYLHTWAAWTEDDTVCDRDGYETVTYSCNCSCHVGASSWSSCNTFCCAQCYASACGNTACGNTCVTYSSSQVSYGSSCTSRSSTCNDGTYSVTPYSYSSCVTATPVPASCSSAACGTVASGGTCTTYSTSLAPCLSSCSSYSRTSTCNNGTWSLTPYSYSSCSVDSCDSCSSAACGTVAHGGSCTTYSSNSPTCGTACSSVSRTSTCSDGSWSSAPYSYSSCTSKCCASGGCSETNAGGACTSYSASSVACGSLCSSVSRTSTCQTTAAWNSAPYANATCSVTGCASCSSTACGTTVHGGTCTSYASASPACGTACSSRLSTCNNGSWDTAPYTNASCSACCNNPWGGTTAQGGTQTGYATASVPCGSTCSSQLSTCTSSGTWSPSLASYANQDCSVTACQSCNLPWGGTIPHGDSVTAYSTTTVACGATCTSQVRTCNDGNLSGDAQYQYGACEPDCPCQFPVSGNTTITSSCGLGATAGKIDGVDSGTGTANTGQITIDNGATLTLGGGNNQTLAYGQINLVDGSIVIPKGVGAQLKKVAIWATDADGDGAPNSQTPAMEASATQPSSKVRRSALTSPTTQYQYKRTITVNGPSSGTLTNYQINITLDTQALIAAGKMQSDCDDIRIQDVNGVLLPHWIEKFNPGCDSTTTKIWTKLPSIGTSGTTIYISYGYPSAVNIESGANVFDFFEDFETDLTKWTSQSGVGFAIENDATYGKLGKQTAAASQIYGSFAGDDSWGDIVLEGRLKTDTNNRGGFFIRHNSTTNKDNGYYVRADTNNFSYTTDDSFDAGGGSYTIDPNIWYNVKITALGTTSNLYVNDTNINLPKTTQYSTGSIGIHAVQSPRIAYFDNVRVRKFASSEPSVASIGVEEGGGVFRVDCNDSNQYVYQNIASTAWDNDTDGYSQSAAGTNCVGTGVSWLGRTYYANTSGYNVYVLNPLGIDCNESDSTKWQNTTYYIDGDSDNYGTGTGSQICSGASTPPGYSLVSGDCNDSNSNIYQNVASTAPDVDQDGYATSAVATNCVGASTSVSGRTYYRNTSGAYAYVLNPLGTSDCNDSLNTVHNTIAGYTDTDQDGYPVSATPVNVCAATLPAGYISALPAAVANGGNTLTFTQQTNLPAIDSSPMSTGNGHYVYLIGRGDNATSQVLRGYDNNGGTLNGWTTTNQTAFAIRSRGAAVTASYGGVPYVYSIGGWNGTTTYGTVNRAAITTNNVGAWSQTNALPSSATRRNISAASTSINGVYYIYVIGGMNDTNFYNTVYKGTVGTGGAVTWTTENALPANRAYHDTVIKEINGTKYIYVIGGLSATSTSVSTIYYHALGADGSISGAWSTTTTPLPQTLGMGKAFIVGIGANNYLYYISGYTYSTTPAIWDRSYYAAIASNGNITSAFTIGTSTPNSGGYYLGAFANYTEAYIIYGTGATTTQTVWKMNFTGSTTTNIDCNDNNSGQHPGNFCIDY